MVTSTGRIVPSCACVRELNSLQKAMMLIPWGPRAVPTGGAGFALPAGICSLTKPTAFFAMILLSSCPAARAHSWPSAFRGHPIDELDIGVLAQNSHGVI